MKTPFTTHGTLHRVLVLAGTVALLFVSTASAGPLEELTDIFTKDRSKPPPAETNSSSQERRGSPPNYPGTSTPTFRFPDMSDAKATSTAPAGVTDCPYRELRRVLVDDAGNISYMVFGGRTGLTRRLAANIDTPAGRTMLQLLLAAASGPTSYIAVAGYYPAGYDCTTSDLTTPALLLAVDRKGR